MYIDIVPNRDSPPAIRRVLRGQTLVAADEHLQIERSLPHGAVADQAQRRQAAHAQPSDTSVESGHIDKEPDAFRTGKLRAGRHPDPAAAKSF